MDTLEAFERAQTLPRDQLFFIPHHVPVLPVKVNADIPQHWQDFNRSAVFFLDDDIVLKMQTQTRVADVDLPSERLLLDISLGSFIARDLERDIFSRLKNTPHPNLVRELEVGEPYISFFEHLSPLTTVWGGADMPRRRRWAMELVSAFAHLENMGLVPKIRVQDLGTDRTGRLKLVGFGSSPRIPSAEEIAQYEADDNKVGNSPSDGIDPDQEAYAITTPQERTSFREKIRRGDYPIAPAASVLQDVLQEAWMLKAATQPFSEITDKIQFSFEGLEVEQEEDLPARLTEDHYRSLEERCREWLRAQEQDPQWMELQEYEAACEQVGC